MSVCLTPSSVSYDLVGKRVFVAGHRGMVGSAIVRRLQQEGCEILTAGRAQLNLTRQAVVEAWMRENRPDVVFVAAARVGGIHANSAYPADFIYDNLMIEANLIHTSFLNGVERLLFLGSSCIYPRDASQPVREDALLTGPLEPTNAWYAVAKIAGIKLCMAYRHQHGADFIAAMPTNLYGPGDNFHHENSHVPAALMRRFHDAKLEKRESAAIWGTGRPLREFLHVDDLADASVFLAKFYSGDEHINVGSGIEISIADFATTMAQVVGFGGDLCFDSTRPDGAPRKLLDCSRLRDMGWKPRVPLADGLASTYSWFLQNEYRSK